MIRGLMDLCTQNKIQIFTNTEVIDIDSDTKGAYVICDHKGLDQIVRFVSERVCICTNAFTTLFFPHVQMSPGRGQVIITKPIKGLKLKGVFHFDQGYYYFRNVGDRILFGGGRNKFMDEETTLEFGHNAEIVKDLTAHLRSWIIPSDPFEIEQQWSGIMAFGPDKLPILQGIDDRIYIGVRLNGMGVAIGSEIGERLAALALS